MANRFERELNACYDTINQLRDTVARQHDEAAKRERKLAELEAENIRLRKTIMEAARKMQRAQK